MLVMELLSLSSGLGLWCEAVALQVPFAFAPRGGLRRPGRSEWPPGTPSVSLAATPTQRSGEQSAGRLPCASGCANPTPFTSFPESWW